MARRSQKKLIEPVRSIIPARIVGALIIALALLSAVAATLSPDGYQFFGDRAPKIALPTLTCVAPNCTPTSKSALIPIERI